VLLRYLSDAYKALVQSVPEGAKTEEVYELSEWLGAVVRQVDSSLIDEWEKLRNPELVASAPGTLTEGDALESDDITKDERGFTVLVRNALFRLVQSLARGEYARAAELAPVKRGEPDWTPEAFEEALAPFLEEHGAIRTDPAARAPKHCVIERSPDVWAVRQTLLDPEDHADFFVFIDVDLAASAEEGRPVLGLVKIGT
jgi:hypothetical protein